jgi:hypothetical protein
MPTSARLLASGAVSSLDPFAPGPGEFADNLPSCAGLGGVGLRCEVGLDIPHTVLQ